MININEKLKYYSKNNILWTLFLSGCGVPYFFNEKELNYINEETGQEDKFLVENLMPIKCIYKEAKPIFSQAPSEIINPGKYVWDFNSFKKEITVKAQVFAILSMINLLKLIPTTKANDFIIKKQVKNFLDFLTAYMRNKDGLFINVEDKTKYIDEKLKIKKDIDYNLLDQILVYEAFLTYGMLIEGQEKIYLNEAEKIFKFIYENFNFILELPTRYLSFIVSSLYRCSKVLKEDSILKELITLSCAEIESRIKISGEVEKSPNNFLAASLTTHFRASSSLMEGYTLTKIEKFKNSAEKIINQVMELFDENTATFINEEEIKYSSKDIAEIFKGLYLYCKLNEDKKMLNILNSFITKILESIIASTVDRKTEFNGYTIEIDEKIPLYSDVNLAPVFVKSLKINNNLIPIYKPSKKVNNEFSLYTSLLLIDLTDDGNNNTRREEDDQHQLLS